MPIRARVLNRDGEHHVTLATGDSEHALSIASKPTGRGSATNGGELLFLALATCYCNDLFREADLRGIVVDEVEVEVAGDFGAPGAPARNVTYRVRVTAQASDAEIRALITHTDAVAEVHNTLRAGIPVTLTAVGVVSRAG
jgi:organic hydroperoxide reductase OsmC/OhrA